MQFELRTSDQTPEGDVELPLDAPPAFVVMGRRLYQWSEEDRAYVRRPCWVVTERESGSEEVRR